MTISLFLLVGGCIAALIPTRRGRKWLLAAMINGIVFEIVRSVPAAMQQWEMAGAMEQMVHRAAGAAGGPPPGFASTMTAVGIVVILVLALIKILYYGIGAWYCLQPLTINWFEPVPDDELREQQISDETWGEQ